MISILMPIYNGIEFIHESVPSILEQTYDKWELLIGINGNPENSEIYKIAKRFEEKSDKVRVFDFYNIKGKSCFTIEKIEDYEPTDDTINFAKKLLELFGIVTLLDLKAEKKQNRYILLTLEDYKSLKNLNQILSGTNLIPAGWHLYGRDLKIGFVLEQINNLQKN